MRSPFLRFAALICGATRRSPFAGGNGRTGGAAAGRVGDPPLHPTFVRIVGRDASARRDRRGRCRRGPRDHKGVGRCAIRPASPDCHDKFSFIPPTHKKGASRREAPFLCPLLTCKALPASADARSGPWRSPRSWRRAPWRARGRSGSGRSSGPRSSGTPGSRRRGPWSPG